MPGAPPAFPRLEPEAAFLPPARRRRRRQDGRHPRAESRKKSGTFRSRPGGNRSGRSEQQFHLRLSVPRTDSRRISLAPGGKSCFLWCPSAGEAHKPRRKSPFPAAASLFAGGFSKTPPGKTGANGRRHPRPSRTGGVYAAEKEKNATSASEPTLRQPYRFILRRSRTSFLSRDDTACSEATFLRGKAAPAAPRGPARAARSAGRRL